MYLSSDDNINNNLFENLWLRLAAFGNNGNNMVEVYLLLGDHLGIKDIFMLLRTMFEIFCPSNAGRRNMHGFFQAQRSHQQLAVARICLIQEAFNIDSEDSIQHTDLSKILWAFAQTASQLEDEIF